MNIITSFFFSQLALLFTIQSLGFFNGQSWQKIVVVTKAISTMLIPTPLRPQNCFPLYLNHLSPGEWRMVNVWIAPTETTRNHALITFNSARFSTVNVNLLQTHHTQPLQKSYRLRTDVCKRRGHSSREAVDCDGYSI